MHHGSRLKVPTSRVPVHASVDEIFLKVQPSRERKCIEGIEKKSIKRLVHHTKEGDKNHLAALGHKDKVPEAFVAGHVDGIVGGDLFGIQFLGQTDDTRAHGPEQTLCFKD